MTRIEPLRLVVGYGGIAFASVYLVLKALWIAGVPFGISAEGLAMDGLLAANLVTAGLALGGVLVLLALTHPWGHRVPAWLVVFPAWIGTGLLVPAGLLMVVTSALAVTGVAPWPTGGGPASAGWVLPVVYTSFTGLGICLAAAFVGHVRQRWPGALDRAAGPADSPTRPIQLPLAWMGTLLAAGSVAVRLQWRLGGTTGLEPANLADRVWHWYAGHLVYALLVLAGSVALLGLAHRRPVRRPGWLLALAWTGTGVLFSTGIVDLGFGMLLRPDAPWTLPEARSVLSVVLFMDLLAGVALGFAALLAAVDRSSTRSVV